MTTCFHAATSSYGAFDTTICVNSASIASTTAITDAPESFDATALAVTDTLWVLVCAILVFWMQAGFAMLEAGTVQLKNTSNILFKNLMDASIGALCFWLIGYSFAYGDENDDKFIGSGNWALKDYLDDSSYVSWFFQWAFAGAAATIVSGAVAERCKLEGYFIYTIVLTSIVYPVVVHWVWDTEGWLSAFSTAGNNGEPYISPNGMIDFAGSGVVHMVGGFAGLVGAIALGPRDVFVKGKGGPHPSSNMMCALGVAILWMGWYGFNCGSTLGAGAFNGTAILLAAKVAVTTTLAPATAAVTLMIAGRINDGYFDLARSLNGILAGLVSITAPCAVVEPWAACLIGFIGAIVYFFSSKALKHIGIDDPLDAFPIHGMCGVWGVLSVGIFAERGNILETYGYDNDEVASGKQFGIQLLGAVSIIAWTVGTSAIIFFPLRALGLLRVTHDIEKFGLDRFEHQSKSMANLFAQDEEPRKKTLFSAEPKTKPASNEQSVNQSIRSMANLAGAQLTEADVKQLEV